jgi:hypothetical protein
MAVERFLVKAIAGKRFQRGLGDKASRFTDLKIDSKMGQNLSVNDIAEKSCAHCQSERIRKGHTALKEKR